jgi:hypothetical protein
LSALAVTPADLADLSREGSRARRAAHFKQAHATRSNLKQENAATAFHMQPMRNVIGAPPQAHRTWRTPMTDRATSSVRRPSRWALVPAIAMFGVLAGLPAAYAFDQQATDDAVDNAMNWQAAHGGTYAGSYAQSTRNQGLVYAPRHRSYR